jgi:hypothetical protein
MMEQDIAPEYGIQQGWMPKEAARFYPFGSAGKSSALLV